MTWLDIVGLALAWLGIILFAISTVAIFFLEPTRKD